MKIIFLFVTFYIVNVTAVRRAAYKDDGDLKAESSRRRIYDIIQEHEGRKYGDHGGHEYEEGEIPGSLKSRKSQHIGYLPIAEEGKSPLYYAVAPKKRYRPKDNVYRENVAAYAAKEANPVSLGNAPHQVVASPLSHSHYAIVDPKTHDQYVVYEDPRQPHKSAPLVLEPKPHHKPSAYAVEPKHTYILEEEPHYVVPHQAVVAKPPAVSHAVHYPSPVNDYNSHYDSHHNLEDKKHHSSGHGYHNDNNLHKESGHKAHGKHEIAGHKSHSSSLGHHDEHDQHHNKAHYERDRGYHYEKAYAYDRIRASHDIGSNKGAHSAYKNHQGHEGYKDVGDHGAQSYMYFKKHGQSGDHGYHDSKNSLYKTGHHGSGQGYHNYGPKYIPHQHAYGK